MVRPERLDMLCAAVKRGDGAVVAAVMRNGSKRRPSFRLHTSVFGGILISTIDATIVKTNKRIQSLCCSSVISTDEISRYKLFLVIA